MSEQASYLIISTIVNPAHGGGFMLRRVYNLTCGRTTQFTLRLESFTRGMSALLPHFRVCGLSASLSYVLSTYVLASSSQICLNFNTSIFSTSMSFEMYYLSKTSFRGINSGHSFLFIKMSILRKSLFLQECINIKALSLLLRN